VKNVPTVVVGIDGGHYELISPWLEDGELPNIRRIVEEGVSADMRSVLPPVTCPNWLSYATGKNPGKLGLYWWRNVDTRNRRIRFPGERRRRTDRYWQLLSDECPVCVVGVPLTAPPSPLNGVLVAGAPDAEEEGYTYPPALEEKLDAEYGYRVQKTESLEHDPDDAAAEVHDLIDLRFEVAKNLRDTIDAEFLQVTTFYINSLHHYFWDDSRTLEGWRRVDDHVGDFLDEGANVVLMSDHGSNAIRTVFNVNSWLEREGYLSVRRHKSEETLHRFGVSREHLATLADRFGARNTCAG